MFFGILLHFSLFRILIGFLIFCFVFFGGVLCLEAGDFCFGEF